VLGTAQDRAGRQEAGKAFETLLPEQKWKEKMADTIVAAGESKKMMSASAPSRLTASAAIKRPVIDMTIQVRDKYAAVREIEVRLGQFNARIVGRQHREESEFLKAEIAAQNIAAFMDRLEAIGRVSMETRPPCRFGRECDRPHENRP